MLIIAVRLRCSRMMCHVESMRSLLKISSKMLLGLMYASIAAAMESNSAFDSVMSSGDGDFMNLFTLFLPKSNELQLDRHHCLTRLPMYPSEKWRRRHSPSSTGATFT